MVVQAQRGVDAADASSSLHAPGDDDVASAGWWGDDDAAGALSSRSRRPSGRAADSARHLLTWQMVARGTEFADALRRNQQAQALAWHQQQYQQQQQQQVGERVRGV